MKKILIAAAFAATAASANAQKGSWYAGGTVGFNSTTNKVDNDGTNVDGAKTNSWAFSPEVGTFLTNHVQLGVGLTFAGSKWDARTNVANMDKSTYTGGTVYSRYFFGSNAFRPFVGINVSVLPGSTEATRNVTVTKTKVMTVGANLNAGFAYGLSKRVCVVGSFGTLGFESKTAKVDGTNVKQKTTSFGLDASSLGNRFNVGVYYTL